MTRKRALTAFLALALAATMPTKALAQNEEPLVSDGLCHAPPGVPNKQVDDLLPVIAQVTIDENDPCSLSVPGKVVKNMVVLFEGHDGYTDKPAQ